MSRTPNVDTRQARRRAERTSVADAPKVGTGNRAIRRQLAAEARGKVRPSALSFRQMLAARNQEQAS